MNLFVAGLSYKTAPVELREKLAVTLSKLRCYGCRLKIGANLTEVAMLSTCNRVEIYGVTPKVNGNIDFLFSHLTQTECDFRPHMYVHEGEQAIRHLLSVTSGLDSMVLGETEITGQVRQAYEKAHECGLTGSVLNRVFQKAQQTSKEIRTRTNVGRGATSVGSVAVELAEKIFGPELVEKTVIIFGAGQMGEACVRHFAKKGARSVLVSNRSFERAEALAREFGGRAVRFDDRVAALSGADIVVSSTGCPHTILHRGDVEQAMRARGNRPLFLIDIAVPRDIDPDVQQIDNVYLYDIDDLEAIVRENAKHRADELARCQDIIEQKTAALVRKLQEIRDRSTARRDDSSGPGKEATPHAVQPQLDWVLCGAAAGRG